MAGNGVGCVERKCPCRTWINCRMYNKWKKQMERLKNKEYPFDFHGWYQNSFKIDVKLGEVACNG